MALPAITASRVPAALGFGWQGRITYACSRTIFTDVFALKRDAIDEAKEVAAAFVCPCPDCKKDIMS